MHKVEAYINIISLMLGQGKVFYGIRKVRMYDQEGGRMIFTGVFRV